MVIHLSYLADLKLKYYVNNIDYEISGVGLAERHGDDIYVTDVFLLRQKVTGANTKLDRKAVNAFIDEKLDNPNFPVENLKLWWHSHNNMDVFWSQTDEETCNGFDLDTEEENWYLSIVCNKKGNRKARVDIFYPFKVVVDDIDIRVGEDKDLEESIRKEITSLVTTDVAKSSAQIYGPGGNVIGGLQAEEENDTITSMPFNPPHNHKKKHHHHH